MELKNEFESATVNETSVFESLKIYCVQFKIPPLSSSPRGQTPNQNVKEPVSVRHYSIKWFMFELEAADVFWLRSQNKNLCWFSPLCLDWMSDFPVSARKQIFNICQRPELHKQFKLACYLYGLIQQKTMMIFFSFFSENWLLTFYANYLLKKQSDQGLHYLPFHYVVCETNAWKAKYPTTSL